MNYHFTYDEVEYSEVLFLLSFFYTSTNNQSLIKNKLCFHHLI